MHVSSQSQPWSLTATTKQLVPFKPRVAVVQIMSQESSNWVLRWAEKDPAAGSEG